MGRLRSRTEYFETSTVDKETIGRLEAKIRDQEAKVDFEQTTRRRLEVRAVNTATAAASAAVVAACQPAALYF